MGQDISSVFYKIVLDKNLKREEREMLVVLKSLDVENSNELVIGRSELLNIFEIKNKDRIYRVLGNLAEKEYIRIDKSIGKVNKYIFIKDYLVTDRGSCVGNVPGGVKGGQGIVPGYGVSGYGMVSGCGSSGHGSVSGDVGSGRESVPGCVTGGQAIVPGHGVTRYGMVSGDAGSGRESVPDCVMGGQAIVPGYGVTGYGIVSGDVGSGRENVPGCVMGGQAIVPGYGVTGQGIVSGDVGSGRETVPGHIEGGQAIVPGYGVTGQGIVPGYTGTGQESVPSSTQYNINNNNINNNINNNNINNNYINNSIEDVFINIFNHWNKQNISNIESLDLKVKDAITTALSRYPFDTIIEAISNYSEVYYSEFFYNIKWNLITFLSSPKGIEKFYDNGCMWLKYKEDNYDRTSRYEEDRIELHKYIDV